MSEYPILHVETYKEAIALLKRKGSYVTVCIAGTETQIGAQKGWFLEIIRERAKHSKGPTDYDGNPACFFWNIEQKKLYVDGSI